MGTKSVQTELNKELVYNFIKENPNSSTTKIAKAFGFTKSQTDYYIRPMVVVGVLNKTMEHNKLGRLTSYTIGKKPYVRKIKTEEEKMDEELAKKLAKILAELPAEVRSVARIVKLSNRHMQPPRKKGSRRNTAVAMGSSMGMFNDF